MRDAYLDTLFGLDGQVAVVTGGSGTLGRALAKGLAGAGARVVLLARREELLNAAVDEVRESGEAIGLQADVRDVHALRSARDAILARWGRIDILVNAAGGSVPAANVQPEGSLFAVPPEALREVVDVFLMGALLPIQIFGEVMARAGGGSIVSLSSMAARRPLTRTIGYGAAKAALDNATQWLAVELARKHGPGVRVNAIAPGFFLAEQNRALLTDPDGSLSSRGRAVIEHTPMGRFGEPEDLVSTLLWLCGSGARFVTGVVVPVDGGFDAYSGV